MIERLEWDEYFMNIAVQVGLRSTCIRRKVGALLVKDNKIVSTGYNGSPKGIPNCSDDVDRCYRSAHNIPSGEKLDLCYAVHAEINAIMNAIKTGSDLSDSVIYVTTFPCSSCVKALIQAGVKKICYLDKYTNEFTLKMIEEAGIECKEMDSKIYRTPDLPNAKLETKDDLDVLDPLIKEIYYAGFEPGTPEFNRNRDEVFQKYKLYEKYNFEKVLVTDYKPKKELVINRKDRGMELYDRIKDTLKVDYRSNQEYNGSNTKQLVVATVLFNPYKNEIGLLKSIDGRLKGKFTMIQGHISSDLNAKLMTIDQPKLSYNSFMEIVIQNLQKELTEEIGILPHVCKHTLMGYIQTNDNLISSEHLGLLYVTVIGYDKIWDIIKSTEPEKHVFTTIKLKDVPRIIESNETDTWLKKYLKALISSI